MLQFNSLQDEIDFFAPSFELKVKVEDVDGEKVAIVDNFFKNPQQIRELALFLPRTRNTKFLHGLPGARVELSCYLGHLGHIFKNFINNLYPEDLPNIAPDQIQDSLDNSRFLVNIQNSNLPPCVPHIDSNHNSGFVAGIYLNTPDECSGGTAFYKFKGSKYIDLANLDPDIREYDQYLLDSDGKNWEKLFMAEMKFNRLVLYRQRVLHTPYILPNTYTDEKPRLTQMIFI